MSLCPHSLGKARRIAGPECTGCTDAVMPALPSRLASSKFKILDAVSGAWTAIFLQRIDGVLDGCISNCVQGTL